MRSRAIALCVVAAALVAGCGGGDEDGGGEEEAAGTAATTQEETAAQATASESLWITAAESGTVHRVDPASGEVLAAIEVGDYPADVAVGHGSVWVADAQSGQVSRIDPKTNKVVATLDTEDARGLAIGDDEVWVSRITTDPPSVVPIDPASGELGEPVETGENRQPEGMVYDDGVLFADEGYSGGVIRIDTGSGDVEVLDLDQVVTDIGFLDGSVFVAGLDSVIQVDPRRMRIAEEYEEDGRPWAFAADEETRSLLVALQSPTVKRLALGGGGFSAATGSLETSGQPYDVALAGGSGWIVDDAGTLHQVDPESLAVQDTVELPGASGPATIEVG